MPTSNACATLLASRTPAAIPASAANGTLFPQPRVKVNGRSVLLDEVTGHGLRLMLGAQGDADQVSALDSVKQCAAQVVQVGGKGLAEADGIVAGWLARHGAVAALVRPDHYVYGVVTTLEEINPLAASFD